MEGMGRVERVDNGVDADQPVPPLLPVKKPEGLCDQGGDLVPREYVNARLPPPIGAGLENLGNTCFLNAVLQCVTHTVPLLRSIQSSPHPYPCSSDRGSFFSDGGRFCSLCALRQHIDICINERDKIVKPFGFVNNLSNISSSFSRYQQEDAHEFLHCFLDNLHNSCLDLQSGNDSLLQKESFIKKIFGGRLRSQVQCCDCGHHSNTYEPLLDLSLEIENAENLEDALESFTNLEKIEDPEVKFTCEGCKACVSVQKQFKLDQAPQVIALHLKRFKSNGYFADKIDKFVKYPMDLDLKPFHSKPEIEDVLKYELYAAVMHQGISSLYGHYYCFVRPSPDLWYIMDDEKVYRVNEETALTQHAYILFYMKRGTPWFSSLLEGEKMNKCLNMGNLTSPVSVVDHVVAYQNLSSDGEDNCNDFVKTPTKDENLRPCGYAPSDSDKNGVERDNNLCPLGAAKCVASEVEGNQVQFAVDGHTLVSPAEVSHADLDTDMKGVNDVSCLVGASHCNLPEIDRKQADDPVSSCSATPHFKPSSSFSPGADEDHVASPHGAAKFNAPANEVKLSDGAVNRSKVTAPCTPKQLSMDKFYDEIWEEDEKENSPKQLLNIEAGKSAERLDDRELAALNSYLRCMPRSRRVVLAQFMRPGRHPSPPSAEHRRKKKLRLDSENSPCRSSNMTRGSNNHLPNSVLHQLLAQDDSHLVLAINSNRSRKRV